MDDLISKRAAVSRISDLLILELKGQRIPTWNEVYNAIGDIPSVPAVPLDKLCKFLSNEIRVCPANPDGPNEYCAFDRCEECWKDAIRRRMEETDGCESMV